MKTINQKTKYMKSEMTYLKKLQTLKAVMDYEGTDFKLNRYSTDSCFRLALVRSGIIKNIGDKRGRGVKWIWNSIEPNIKMAKAIMDLKREIEREKNRKKYVKKVVTEKGNTPKKYDNREETEKKSECVSKNIKCNYNPKKRISIFWGLIKIEKL